MSNTNQPHHNTRWYKKTAPIVRQAAYNDPGYRCPHCHLTLAEMPAHRPGNVVGWDAGHLVDGDERHGLQAECRYCNRSRGSKARHGQTHPVNSRRWA